MTHVGLGRVKIVHSRVRSRRTKSPSRKSIPRTSFLPFSRARKGQAARTRLKGRRYAEQLARGKSVRGDYERYARKLPAN